MMHIISYCEVADNTQPRGSTYTTDNINLKKYLWLPVRNKTSGSERWGGMGKLGPLTMGGQVHTQTARRWRFR